MADIRQVCDAMIERMVPVLPAELVWRTSWFEPNPIGVVPLLCVAPDPTWIELGQNLGSYGKWALRVRVYLDTANEDESRTIMAPLLGNTGIIVQRMTDRSIRDDLYDLCGRDFSLDIKATNGRGWEISRKARGRYLWGDHGFLLGSN